METSPEPWIAALRHSHNRLQAAAEPLDGEALRQPSYASEWSIAQILSHLGSQAEIFGMFLDAGLTGTEPPGRDAFPPIWAAWNSRGPESQAADALRADEAITERFESLDRAQRSRLRLRLFGRDLDATGLAQMRLSEHALHTWDIAVALDPAATVAPDAVGLLVDTLGELVARAARPDGKKRRLHVSTTSPDRSFVLETGDAVTLAPAAAGTPPGLRLPGLRLPAEALVRLVYGRLDPAHTPPFEGPQADLEQLRRIFPGF